MSDGQPLRLDGELNIQVAGERLPVLAQAAQAAGLAGTDLALALDGVEAFDSAGVQLLLSLRKTLADYGVGLHIVSASDTVRSVFTTYGLTGLLGLAPAEGT